MSSSRRRLVVVLVALLAAVTTWSTPSSADEPRKQGVEDNGLHRVVWDAGRLGVHVRSANLDGTELRDLYNTRRGFVIDLTLSRDGQRVAFAPCCHDHLPLLVVVPVDGGTALEPLERHPRIYFVGGIGWSPDGRRIVFEGAAGHSQNVRTYLWTVRPDGTGLRRREDLGSLEDYDVINEALAWTRAGILYSDGRNLRVSKGGESRIVLRRVWAVRISGDGRQIITMRRRGGQWSVWASKPDGTERRRLFIAGAMEQDYSAVTPNYDATALLASYSSDPVRGSLVTWPIDEDPSSATTLEVTGRGYAATWN